MFYTIYKTTNTVNNKIYIGKHQSKNPYDNYLGSGKCLKRAIRKYGKDVFKKDILFTFETEQEMDNKEKELVTEEFCLREDTYNICEGGHGGFGFINRNKTFEQRSELSKKIAKQIVEKRNKNYPKEIRATWLEKAKKNTDPKKMFGHKRFLGKVHSEQTKQKMREKASLRTGSKNSQYGSYWLTNGIDSKKIRIDLIPEGWYKGRNM